MKNLVVNNNGQPVTNSLLVAEKFGKRHSDVIRAIEGVIKQTPENQRQRNFALVEYKDGKGEMRPMYMLTKDGFSAVVLGFTGAKAVEFRWEFINAFNEMERIITEGNGIRVAAVEENIRRRYLLTEERKKVNADINALMKRHDTICKELHTIDVEDFQQLRLFPRCAEEVLYNVFPNRKKTA